MMLGITLTNGIVVGFEFSSKYKIAQLHLTFFSFVLMWGIGDEDGASCGVQ